MILLGPGRRRKAARDEREERAVPIAKVDVFQLVHRLGQTRGPSSAWYDRRESVLVRVADDDGVCGWGETYVRPGVVGALEALGELLVGTDPLRPRALLAGRPFSTADGFARSALAIALDDLRGRRLGVPVADLYGGRIRDRVRAYASSGGYFPDVGPEESWPGEAARLAGKGFGAVKLRIGRYAVDRELRALERVREVVPAEVDLMADGNGAYTLPAAIRMGRGLERLGFRWFEEPLPRTAGGVNYPRYDELAAALDIAVASGEGLETRSAFAEFLAAGKGDIVQPDVAICGGVADTLFVGELAALSARPCVPHAWGGAILLAATLQVHALLPHATEVAEHDPPLLEYDAFENPILSDLASGTPRPVGGWVEIPTGPGLGIEVDEEVVERLAVHGPAAAR
jgi:D-galactarolactone cycloisomerase